MNAILASNAPASPVNVPAERLSVARLSSILRLSQAEDRTATDLDGAVRDLLNEYYAINEDLAEARRTIAYFADQSKRRRGQLTELTDLLEQARTEARTATVEAGA